MDLIATAWQDRTFTYTQIERQGMSAIYAQTHKEGGQTRYEVIRIRIRPEHTWPNGNTTPEHEGYPGGTAWGRDGWTLYRMNWLQVLRSADASRMGQGGRQEGHTKAVRSEKCVGLRRTMWARNAPEPHVFWSACS